MIHPDSIVVGKEYLLPVATGILKLCTGLFMFGLFVGYGSSQIMDLLVFLRIFSLVVRTMDDKQKVIE